jgi:rubredoxin
MQKHPCTVGGYRYGSAKNNGVPLENLTDGLVFPDCSAGKDVFVPV